MMSRSRATERSGCGFSGNLGNVADVVGAAIDRDPFPPVWLFWRAGCDPFSICAAISKRLDELSSMQKPGDTTTLCIPLPRWRNYLILKVQFAKPGCPEEHQAWLHDLFSDQLDSHCRCGNALSLYAPV